MSDIQAADVTYVSTPTPLIQRAGNWPLRSSLSDRQERLRPTSMSTELQRGGSIFVSSDSVSGGDLQAINYRIESIAVGNVVPLIAAAAATTDADAPVPTLVETVASQRVRLLAKLYEKKASPEDSARIEILTVRLSRLAPRTTEADIAKLEETAAAADEIHARIGALSAEFGV